MLVGVDEVVVEMDCASKEEKDSLPIVLMVGWLLLLIWLIDLFFQCRSVRYALLISQCCRMQSGLSWRCC